MFKFLNDKKYISKCSGIREHCFSGQAQVAQKSWKIKNIWQQWKIQGKLCFSGQAQVGQESWMTKSIFNTWKNFREISVFRASGICSKILKNNKYCSTVKNFRPNSVNQGKRRSSNITKVETDGQGLYLKLFSGKGLSRVVLACIWNKGVKFIRVKDFYLVQILCWRTYRLSAGFCKYYINYLCLK